MNRKTILTKARKLLTIQCILLLSIIVSMPLHCRAQEPQPIEIRRVVIDLELLQTVGVQLTALANKRGAEEPLLREGNHIFLYGRAFQSAHDFNPNALEKHMQEAFYHHGFQVEGYGNIFRELRETKPTSYAIGIEIDDFMFNFFTSIKTGESNDYRSEMTVRLIILDLNQQKIRANKEVVSRANITRTGLLTNPLDLNYFFEKSFAKLVDDMLADPEIRDILYAEKKTSDLQYDGELRLSVAGAPERTPIKSAMEATVTIRSGSGHGSGAIISPEGLILTCHHNIHAAEEVQIIFSNGIRTTAKVLRKDPEYDLVLLQLSDIQAKPLYLAEDTEPEPGSEAWVIGTPASTDLGQSVSRGVVSGNRVIDEKLYIQTDASVNPGNSGGPMLNANGRIIGIVNAKVMATGVEGLGFAIPTATIMERLKVTID